MSSRALFNLVLLAMVIALAWVAWKEPGKPEQEMPPLAIVSAEAVHSIEIERKGRDTLRFERRDDGWWMVEPHHARANKVQMEAVLALPSAESHDQYPINAVTPAKVGLDAPTVTLHLDELTLTFGGTDPLHHRRYVRTGDTVHLIDDSDFYLLRRDATDFVSLALLAEGAEITGLKLPEFELRYRAEGGWGLEPDQPEISADARQSRIDAWKNARATEVTALAKQALEGDLVTIARKGSDEPLDLRIVARDPELKLADHAAGLEYRFSSDATKRMLRWPAPEKKAEPEPDATDGTAAAPEDESEPDEAQPVPAP